MINKFLIILIAIALVGCETFCEMKLSKLDKGSILDTLNTEFSILTGSNLYDATFNDFSKLKFNSIDGDNGLIFEYIEMDDIDSLRMIVDKDSIFLEYSHVQYGCTEFVPYLSYSGDTLTIKCRNVYYGELSCYGGKITSNSSSTSCINVTIWKVQFSKKIIKNGIAFFQPNSKENYELPINVDTSYIFIPIKGSTVAKSEIGFGRYVNYTNNNIIKTTLLIKGQSLNEKEEGFKTNIIVTSETSINDSVRVRVDEKGIFEIDLETGIKYQLTCSQNGFKSKIIIIDTRNSGSYKGGYKIPIEIILKRIDNTKKEISSVGLIFYDKEKDWYDSKSNGYIVGVVASPQDAKKNFSQFRKSLKIKKCDTNAALIPLPKAIKAQKGNIFLAGDAACQVKFTGGGIIPAIESAFALHDLILQKNSVKSCRLKREILLHELVTKVLSKLNAEDFGMLFETAKKTGRDAAKSRDKLSKWAVRVVLRNPKLLKFLPKLL